MINRDEALNLMEKYLKDKDNISYSIVIEFVMREIAKKLDRDQELWGLTGLLHNLDYEYTASELENRGTLSYQLLEGLLPEQGLNAIKANNYTHTDYIPVTAIDKCLIATDSLVGLILAIIRTIPSKNINDVDINLLITKFKDENFAQRYNRNRIKLCTDIGFNLRDFLEITLNTLKNNKQTLGF
jgi:hypothetical protein